MDYKYHPKMLKIFSKEELDLIMESEGRISCVDDDGRVDYILVLTDKLNAEIYIGVNAKENDYAIIYNLNNPHDENKTYFGPLDSRKFLKIFKVSKATKITFFEVD